jgi:hypothetical protein
MATIEIQEMMLMALVVFFALKYRQAKRKFRMKGFVYSKVKIQIAIKGKLFQMPIGARFLSATVRMRVTCSMNQPHIIQLFQKSIGATAIVTYFIGSLQCHSCPYCFSSLNLASAAWAFLKSSTTPLMQYRNPVGGGPSLNTWPRCDLQRPHSTSVRFMPYELSDL